MASLTGATTSTFIKCTLSTSAIITPCPQDIGRSVTDTALAESGYESRSSFGVSQSSFLEQVGADAFVV